MTKPDITQIPVADIIGSAIANKEKWERGHYIGASEIAACPLKLYWDKTEDDGFRGNGKTERGHAIEVALIRLLKKGGLDIRYHAGHVDHQKELTAEGYPVRAHPDGIVYKSRKPWAVLEVKSVSTDRFRQLKEPDESWVVQARLNAWMAKLPTALLVAVDASDLENVKEWRFDAFGDTEAKMWLEKARKIYAAIDVGIEPLPEPSAQHCRWCTWAERCEERWIPDDEAKDKTVEVPELTEALEKMKEASRMEKEAKEIKKAYRPLVIEAAKEHDAANLVAGHVLAKITTRKPSVTLDKKKLMADHPEIDFKAYEKVGKPSLSLTIKEMS